MTIEVAHVTQPTPHTCAHACLSMVTGIPVQDLIDRFGNHGVGDDVTLAVLTEMGIFPVVMPLSYYDPMILSGVYMVTVPSLNMPGRNHSIVISVNDDGDFRVFDPNKGRADREYYDDDSLAPNPDTKWVMHGRSDITLLRSLPKHFGTVERIARYAARMASELRTDCNNE